jgi:site-specific DNA-methyltransferase (adenine-specific)
MAENVLYYGDNLEILRRYIKDESVDLIYIDPPFNSNRNYEVFWGETKEKRSFEDRHASRYVKVMPDDKTISHKAEEVN